MPERFCSSKPDLKPQVLSLRWKKFKEQKKMDAKTSTPNKPDLSEAPSSVIWNVVLYTIGTGVLGALTLYLVR